MATDPAEAMRAMAEAMAEVERTVLRGWPYADRLPDAGEGSDIEAIRNELSLHLPDLSDKRAWEIAGNCVARCALERSREGIASR